MFILSIFIAIKHSDWNLQIVRLILKFVDVTVCVFYSYNFRPYRKLNYIESLKIIYISSAYD